MSFTRLICFITLNFCFFLPYFGNAAGFRGIKPERIHPLSKPAFLDRHYEIINKGIGGNNSNDLLKRIEKDVLAELPDLVIMMVGSNDMLNSKKLISFSQFRDNYQLMIDKMKAQNIKVLLMAPPPVDEAYVLERHEARFYTMGLNEKIDSAGSIVKELAIQNGLYFVNLNSTFKELGSPNRKESSLIINDLNRGIKDGIHPTEEGYELIGRTVSNYLQQNRLLDGVQKILCFGDSITFGSFMKGAGSSEGDTYPSALKRFINQQNDEVD